MFWFELGALAIVTVDLLLGRLDRRRNEVAASATLREALLDLHASLQSWQDAAAVTNTEYRAYLEGRATENGLYQKVAYQSTDARAFIDDITSSNARSDRPAKDRLVNELAVYAPELRENLERLAVNRLALLARLQEELEDVGGGVWRRRMFFSAGRRLTPPRIPVDGSRLSELESSTRALGVARARLGQFIADAFPLGTLSDDDREGYRDQSLDTLIYSTGREHRFEFEADSSATTKSRTQAAPDDPIADSTDAHSFDAVRAAAATHPIVKRLINLASQDESLLRRLKAPIAILHLQIVACSMCAEALALERHAFINGVHRMDHLRDVTGMDADLVDATALEAFLTRDDLGCGLHELQEAEVALAIEMPDMRRDIEMVMASRLAQLESTVKALQPLAGGVWRRQFLSTDALPLASDFAALAVAGADAGEAAYTAWCARCALEELVIEQMPSSDVSVHIAGDRWRPPFRWPGQ